eukprot:TRINITY_DN98661_c0_g1_i1.p1 TRINITY_DN98661_c0_g1~~TRINITY_DN98661_c0_g1_i1.p1  ORF type:complete len:244 (+),score=71.46 TRINITY_DN98661_c0_g1_i1:102-833(+)
MAAPTETPQKKPLRDEQVDSVEKPTSKKRKEMSTSELAVSDAEKEFSEARKTLKASKNGVKQKYVELDKKCKSLQKDVKSLPSQISRRSKAFDALIKKALKDAGALKKENGYETLESQTLEFADIEADLWEELRAQITGEHKAAVDIKSSSAELGSLMDLKKSLRVDEWNRRATSGTGSKTESYALDRPLCVKIWKKSNLVGGVFNQKKLNYISKINVTYDRNAELLKLSLTLKTGEPPADEE